MNNENFFILKNYNSKKDIKSNRYSHIFIESKNENENIISKTILFGKTGTLKKILLKDNNSSNENNNDKTKIKDITKDYKSKTTYSNFNKSNNFTTLEKDSLESTSLLKSKKNFYHSLNKKRILTLNPNFNSTFNFQTKRLSNPKLDLNYFKYCTLNTIIGKKYNVKKFSNFNDNQSKFSSSKSGTNNDIDESIKTISNNNFFLPKTQRSSSISESKFKIKSEKFEIDKFLHKTIKGKFNWIAGEILSEGINNIVYKSYNQDNGTIFVVKRFNCPQGKTCETFITEVKMYEQLNHSNIIKYYGSEEIDNSYFIYLEYLPSGSLKNIIDKYGGINEKLIRKYTKQILDGLKYLHDKGIIHRDIKCANILIDSKGKVKLTDFGCSKQISMTLSDSSSNEEFCSSLKGTIPWCAPEVIKRENYGFKADIWSLGCTLIEMTGNKIWGKIDNLYQIMTTIGNTNDTPKIPSFISETFKSFLMLCLVRKPENRASLKNLLVHDFVCG